MQLTNLIDANLGASSLAGPRRPGPLRRGTSAVFVGTKRRVLEIARRDGAACRQDPRPCFRGPGIPGACRRVAAGIQRAGAGAVVLEPRFLHDLQDFRGKHLSVLHQGQRL